MLTLDRSARRRTCAASAAAAASTTKAAAPSSSRARRRRVGGWPLPADAVQQVAQAATARGRRRPPCRPGRRPRRPAAARPRGPCPRRTRVGRRPGTRRSAAAPRANRSACRNGARPAAASRQQQPIASIASSPRPLQRETVECRRRSPPPRPPALDIARSVGGRVTSRSDGRGRPDDDDLAAHAPPGRSEPRLDVGEAQLADRARPRRRSRSQRCAGRVPAQPRRPTANSRRRCETRTASGAAAVRSYGQSELRRDRLSFSGVAAAEDAVVSAATSVVPSTTRGVGRHRLAERAYRPPRPPRLGELDVVGDHLRAGLGSARR